MARKKRHHQPYAIHHVMMRGNNKQNIFFNDLTRKKFLHYLEYCIEKYDCKVHLFCMMTNHIHLVIQTNHIPLPKIMQTLNSAFTGVVNMIEDRVGHLFQGRYVDKSVLDEQYLLELAYYIHANPLSAGLVSHWDDYAWSSHLQYSGIYEYDWLTTHLIENLIAKRFGNGVSGYRKFLDTWKSLNPEAKFCQFTDEGLLTVNDEVKETTVPKQKGDFSLLTISEIIDVVAVTANLTVEQLRSSSRHRKICLARSVCTYAAHYYGKHTLTRISMYLHREPNSISHTLSRHLKLEPFGVLLKQVKKALACAVDEKIERFNRSN